MAKKKSTKKNNSLSSAQKVGIGVGLTAAAVAAAGVYFLHGSPRADKNKAKVKSWMFKAKAEVLEALEQAENMTEREYFDLIDLIGSTYSAIQNSTQGEIADFKREMKAHWKKIERSSVAKKVKKVAKKAAKNVMKNTIKKTQKKTVKKASKKVVRKKK